MDSPSSSLQSLAKQLLSLEVKNNGTSANGAVRVCEKLGAALTRFAGPEGFNSLMRRSLILARAGAPSLDAVTFKPDGSLEGLEALASDTSNGGQDAVIAIIANLLALLVTFIGEPLTLRLVREAWPDASFNKGSKNLRRL